jgi:signal transduction histidine kinase
MKTLAVFVGTTICLIGLLHVVSENIILDNFTHLEQTQVSGAVGQVQIALTNEFVQLQNKAKDWAQRDDVCGFLNSQSSQFNTSTQALNSWVNLGANYILACNVTGSVAAGVGFNLTTYQQVPVPDSLLKEIPKNPKIWNLKNFDSSTTGIIVLPEGPLIVASTPIPSAAVGEPVQGTLVLARYLDAGVIAALSRSMQLPVTYTLYSEWQSTNAKLTESTAASLTFSEPLNTNYIVGYNVVDDINGSPAVVLGVTMPRSVYVQGVITVNYIDRLVLISCVVFSVAILILLEFLYLSKLSKLNGAVSVITKHKNPSERLPTKGNDEIETLTKSINTMLDEIEDNNSKLQKAERFSAIGELASMVAHDLRNPLQGIANAAFYLKRTADPSSSDKEKDMIRLIENNVRYSDKIVRDLLDYSREIRLDLQQTTPRALLWETLSLVSVPEKVKLVDLTADEPPIKVDVDKMKRVFANLINNAVDAMPDGGTLTIKCQGSNPEACFTFSDTGTGMTEETRQKIFTPLFTTKAKGMGFGLSICKRIVDAHGGRIVVNSVVEKGSEFNIYLSTTSNDQKEGGEKN